MKAPIIIQKEASVFTPIWKGTKAAMGFMAKNPYAKRAAIGAGTGAVVGGTTGLMSGSVENQGSNALKGAILGAGVGLTAGLGSGSYKAWKAHKPVVGTALAGLAVGSAAGTAVAGRKALRPPKPPMPRMPQMPPGMPKMSHDMRKTATKKQAGSRGEITYRGDRDCKEGEGISLYSHWGGAYAPLAVRKAIAAINKEKYPTSTALLGALISTYEPDDVVGEKVMDRRNYDWNPMLVDAGHKTVSLMPFSNEGKPLKTWSYDEFINDKKWMKKHIKTIADSPHHYKMLVNEYVGEK